MKYHIKMVTETTKQTTIELIKEKLTPIEFVILVHELKKELKEELKKSNK